MNLKNFTFLLPLILGIYVACKKKPDGPDRFFGPILLLLAGIDLGLIISP